MVLFMCTPREGRNWGRPWRVLRVFSSEDRVRKKGDRKDAKVRIRYDKKTVKAASNNNQYAPPVREPGESAIKGILCRLPAEMDVGLPVSGVGSSGKMPAVLNARLTFKRGGASFHRNFPGRSSGRLRPPSCLHRCRRRSLS